MKSLIAVSLVVFLSLCASQCLVAQVIESRTILDELLRGNQVQEDFESYQVDSGEADSLGVPLLDSTTVANGQGPGLVEAGAAYIHTFDGSTQWNGDDYFSLESKTFFTGFDMEIVYDIQVNALGFDLQAFTGFDYLATISVFDLDDNLVFETSSFSVTSTTSEFFGYQHEPGISRILMSDDSNSWSPIIDNHGYGFAIPEPGVSLFLFCLASCVGLKRRRLSCLPNTYR